MNQLDIFTNEPEKKIEYMLTSIESGEEIFIGPYTSRDSAINFKGIGNRFAGPYEIPKKFDKEILISQEEYFSKYTSNNPQNFY